MTSQEKARDKRLRKSYGWTLEMVNELSRIQGGRCGACGRKPKDGGMPLNVDHIHYHVRAYRLVPGSVVEYSNIPPVIPPDARWYANVQEMPNIFVTGKTKREVIQKAHAIALPRSVRGLLCAGRYAGCNRLLGRIDDPALLRQFLNYLENPPAKKITLKKEAA